MFEFDRELTTDDIERLATDPTIGRTGPPILKQLKDHHHAIARHLASGKTVLETADLVGLTPQRVGDLQRTDPAFQNLLDYYRNQVTEAGVDEAREFRGKLRRLGRRGLEVLADRFDDEKAVAEMSTDEVRRVTEMALDRTDAPPRTAQQAPPTPTNITFNMGPRTLIPKTIEHEPQTTNIEETGPIDIEPESNDDDDKGSNGI
jgi:hypothetical protein